MIVSNLRRAIFKNSKIIGVVGLWSNIYIYIYIYICVCMFSNNSNYKRMTLWPIIINIIMGHNMIMG